MATTRLCSIPGCGKLRHQGPYCQTHWYRWDRYGDPLAALQGIATPATDFFNRALAYESNDCLIWPFALRRGYPTIWRGDRQQYAHKLICEIAHGGPPVGIHHAAHRCGTRACINPQHLRWATPTENNADKIPQGHSGRGERHAKAKLTEADVRAIRVLAHSIDRDTLAARFGITKPTLSKAILRKTWYWVD